MANTVIATYDPQDIILALGTFTIEGFGDGGITIARNEDIASSQVGILGDVTVNTMRNKTGTLTINLKAHSLEDKTLREVITQGQISAFPVLLKEKSSDNVLITQGWFQSQPDFVAASEIDDREWVIGLASVEFGFAAAAGTAAEWSGIDL